MLLQGKVQMNIGEKYSVRTSELWKRSLKEVMESSCWKKIKAQLGNVLNNQI